MIFLNDLIVKANDEKEKDCCYSFVAYFITAILICASFGAILFYYFYLPAIYYQDTLYGWLIAIAIDITILEIILEIGLRLSECIRELAAKHAGREKKVEEEEEEEED